MTSCGQPMTVFGAKPHERKPLSFNRHWMAVGASRGIGVLVDECGCQADFVFRFFVMVW
jgi:hypothetical protein